MRTHMVTSTRRRSLYPFVVLFACAPFILYMHHSKIGPRGLVIESLYQRILYYHADLVLYVLVAGLLWLVKSSRQWSLVAFSVLYYLAAFDWLSWHVQDKSFLFADLYRAVQLLIHYPEFISALTTGIKARAIILFALPLVFAVALRSGWARRAVNQLHRPLGIISASTAAGAMLLAPFAVSGSYAQQSSVAHMVTSQLYDWELQRVDVDRASMRIPFGQNGTPAAAVGEHAESDPTGDNVVIFILETAPSPEYPDLGELAAELEHPWLKHNSIVFGLHYGTYPASDRANYSILSGLYPPMVHDNNWKSRMRYVGSLPQTLASHGYTSYLFSTAPLSFYQDDVMFQRLGFTHLREVEGTKSLRVRAGQGYRWDRARLYEMDAELIEITIETLGSHSSGERAGPFMAAVAPQSSHAPLNCPPEYRDPPGMCESEAAKFHINAKWQFGLVERLIEGMEAAGLLDSSILVITGDHGIRSKHESTSFFNANVLQQRTFHVPLMIASSRLGGLKRRYDHPTSHVDIAPTVLDLLRLTRTDTFFHGRSLFDDSPRTVYFIGTGYLPVTGFLQNGRYYMENRSNDSVLSSPAMRFDDPELTTSDAETRRIVREELLRLEAFLRREYRPSVDGFMFSRLGR